ncbi:UDP-glucose 4-epimerase isoform X1 [Strix uralensis]|uniref:UDP-glucose 4-epimerase isoform X1 n=1 Tax=Strix uralensis TaxID=36305 RepID=UPI003DA750DE
MGTKPAAPTGRPQLSPPRQPLCLCLQQPLPQLLGPRLLLSPRSPQAPRCCSPCRSSTRSRAGGRETWPPATPTRRWPSASWAGKLPLAWTRCARTCGGGSCRIPQASARTEPWPEGSPGCCGLLQGSPRGRHHPGCSSSSPSCLLHGGRKAGAPPASLLVLIPPGPLHLIEQKPMEEQSQGPALAPRARNPLVGTHRGWCWPRQGGVAWLGPAAPPSAAPGPSLCPGKWLHPALKHTGPVEPKLLRNPPIPCCSWSPHSPLPWATEPLPHSPRNPPIPHSHRDQTHPEPTTAHFPRAEAPMAAKGFPPINTPSPLPPRAVLGTKPHLPHAPVPAPGMASSAWLLLDVAGAWFSFVACGSRFHHHGAKGCPALLGCQILVLFITGSS